jgi:hypothetical protein
MKIQAFHIPISKAGTTDMAPPSTSGFPYYSLCARGIKQSIDDFSSYYQFSDGIYAIITPLIKECKKSSFHIYDSIG